MSEQYNSYYVLDLLWLEPLRQNSLLGCIQMRHPWPGLPETNPSHGPNPITLNHFCRGLFGEARSRLLYNERGGGGGVGGELMKRRRIGEERINAVVSSRFRKINELFQDGKGTPTFTSVFSCFFCIHDLKSHSLLGNLARSKSIQPCCGRESG